MGSSEDTKSRIVEAVKNDLSRGPSAAGHTKYSESSFSKDGDVFTKEGFDKDGAFTRDSFTKSVD